MTLIATKLTKTFTSGRGSERVVKRAASDVSIRVDAGDFVAVVGESGSGKSTTARMMLDLTRPDSGTITWDGADLAAQSSQGFLGSSGAHDA